MQPFARRLSIKNRVALTNCAGVNNLADCVGTVSVNGYTITIPKNTLVAFPAAFVPFIQLVTKFNTAGSGYAGLEVTVRTTRHSKFSLDCPYTDNLD